MTGGPWINGLIIGIGLGCIPAAFALVIFLLAHHPACNWCRAWLGAMPKSYSGDWPPVAPPPPPPPLPSPPFANPNRSANAHRLVSVLLVLTGFGFGQPNVGHWGGGGSRGWYVPAGPTWIGSSTSGQIICQKDKPKLDLAAYHSGDQYGPKYAGMYCIGPLQ